MDLINPRSWVRVAAGQYLRWSHWMLPEVRVTLHRTNSTTVKTTYPPSSSPPSTNGKSTVEDRTRGKRPRPRFTIIRHLVVKTIFRATILRCVSTNVSDMLVPVSSVRRVCKHLFLNGWTWCLDRSRWTITWGSYVVEGCYPSNNKWWWWTNSMEIRRPCRPSTVVVGLIRGDIHHNIHTYHNNKWTPWTRYITVTRTFNTMLGTPNISDPRNPLYLGVNIPEVWRIRVRRRCSPTGKRNLVRPTISLYCKCDTEYFCCVGSSSIFGMLLLAQHPEAFLNFTIYLNGIEKAPTFFRQYFELI